MIAAMAFPDSHTSPVDLQFVLAQSLTLLGGRLTSPEFVLAVAVCFGVLCSTQEEWLDIKL